MNIAHITPYSKVFPLASHNGRYEWMLRLARRQAADGHTVTIYAGPNSTDTSSIIWQSVATAATTPLERNQELIRAAFANPDHDIFHSHYDSLPHTLASLTKKPLITTQHWSPTTTIADGLKQNARQNIAIVPPTRYMAKVDETLGLKPSNVIMHGIDLERFHPLPTHSDRLLFVGRIVPEKGVIEAIEYASRAKKRLDIVGKRSEKHNEYWERVSALLTQEIRYLGPKTQDEVAVLMADASCLLFPSQHEEAFGLVTVEALACGTPVIISDVGASAELVENGVTGFVASTEQEFIDAIAAIDSIDRVKCREASVFYSFDRMYQQYMDLYLQLVHES